MMNTYIARPITNDCGFNLIAYDILVHNICYTTTVICTLQHAEILVMS